MIQVVMDASGICPSCIMAKQIFDDLDISCRDIRVDQHPEACREMIETMGRRIVLQVFTDDRHVGGFDETGDALRSGQVKVELKEVGIHV